MIGCKVIYEDLSFLDPHLYSSYSICILSGKPYTRTDKTYGHVPVQILIEKDVPIWVLLILSVPAHYPTGTHMGTILAYLVKCTVYTYGVRL